jgi:spore germination protein GerM
MRISLVVLVLAFAGLLAVDLAPSSTPQAAVAVPTRSLAAAKRAPETVEVAFVRNGWIVRVERLVPKRMSSAEAALRELTQGPTRAERRKGIRTALPESARLRSLRTDGETWFASFSRSTLGSGSADTKRTRLWQITATLAAIGD